MVKPGFFVSALLATALTVPQIAEARGGFGGRVPRMNFGGGGFHGGGSFHGGGFNGTRHFEARYHVSGGVHPPHGPSLRPAGHHPPPPSGGGHYTPRPSGGGHHPPPHPPGPPPGPHGWGPPPPPRPYYPGYWRPAVAWGAVTATAIAIGTVVATVPPECTNFVVNGITYRDCSGRWFAPRYDGHAVVYVAVADPR